MILIEENKVRFTPYIIDAKSDKNNFCEFEIKGDFLFYKIVSNFTAYDLIEEGSEPLLNKYDWVKYSTYEEGNLKVSSIGGIAINKKDQIIDKDVEVKYTSYEVIIGADNFTSRADVETLEEAQEIRDALNKIIFGI